MKSIESLIDIDLIKNAIIFSAIYQLLFNTQSTYNIYWDGNVNLINNFISFTRYFIYSYIAVFVIFMGISISNITNMVGIPFLFFSGSISSYYFYMFSSYPSYRVVANFLRSDIIGAFFDVSKVGLLFYLWLVFCSAILFFSVKHFKLKSANTYSMKIFSLFFLLVSIYNIVSPQYIVTYNANPLNYLNSIFIYYKSFY
jgi:hypothetical protein